MYLHRYRGFESLPVRIRGILEAMQKIIFPVLILLAATAVAIADVFLKKASLSGSLGAALRSPWMLGAVGLYLFQIFFFTYVFVSGIKLSVVGILQTILYALIVLLSGVFFFKESLSTLQIIGIALGVAGVILLSLK